MLSQHDKGAILRDIAKAVATQGSLNGEEVDNIDLVEGELLVDTEEGTVFAIKVENI